MANLHKIKTLAEKQNVTLEALAEKVGITVQAIHLMVRKNSTKVETLERIAKALRVSVVEFFDEEVVAQYNEATASGAGSGATNKGNIKIVNQATPAASACSALSVSADDDPRVLKERIKGLEVRLQDKDEIISLLKQALNK